MAVSFLVIREPVKKHGPGVACGLDSGDAVEAIPFRKLIFAATPAPGFTHGGRAIPDRKTTRSGKSASQMSTLNEHAAGLDVGSTFHVVAVRGDQDKESVRTFRCWHLHAARTIMLESARSRSPSRTPGTPAPLEVSGDLRRRPLLLQDQADRTCFEFIRMRASRSLLVSVPCRRAVKVGRRSLIDALYWAAGPADAQRNTLISRHATQDGLAVV